MGVGNLLGLKVTNVVKKVKFYVENIWWFLR